MPTIIDRNTQKEIMKQIQFIAQTYKTIIRDPSNTGFFTSSQENAEDEIREWRTKLGYILDSLSKINKLWTEGGRYFSLMDKFIDYLKLFVDNAKNWRNLYYGKVGNFSFQKNEKYSTNNQNFTYVLNGLFAEGNKLITAIIDKDLFMVD
jgi:hypothetical protein